MNPITRMTVADLERTESGWTKSEKESPAEILNSVSFTDLFKAVDEDFAVRADSAPPAPPRKSTRSLSKKATSVADEKSLRKSNSMEKSSPQRIEEKVFEKRDEKFSEAEDQTPRPKLKCQLCANVQYDTPDATKNQKDLRKLITVET